jgi:general secretion pathway protein E
MGIEPFLLSSSLVGVVAQRLVRLLDPDNKEAHTANEYECRELGVDLANPPTIYRPLENAPMGEGYKGRSGIYEIVSINDEFRTMIHDGAGEHELERYARNRSRSIRQDGLRKVLTGETTLEEVLRVTRSD